MEKGVSQRIFTVDDRGDSSGESTMKNDTLQKKEIR
jgi:hypothetical protein